MLAGKINQRETEIVSCKKMRDKATQNLEYRGKKSENYGKEEE